MERNKYNLSNIVHLAGQIGRLQTIGVYPVTPGDSLEVNIDGIMRLAPTRKEIVSETQVDICAFYVKHRQIANQDWTEFVRMGPQENFTWTGIPVAADYRDPFYLGIKTCGAEVNRFLVRGYNFIYQRYFAVPSSATTPNGNTITNLDFYPTTETGARNMRRFGALVARLPHILNGFNILNSAGSGGYDTEFLSDDYALDLTDVAPDVAQLDVRDLQNIKARFKTVTEANWFAQYYDDILEARYNTKGVNTDADPRPDYLGRTTVYLSGSDINGTDDATLGSYVGKTLDRVHFSFPRRFFPEHGNVWIMMVPRFPLIHTDEQHPLLVNPNPDGNLWLGDPTLYEAQQPVEFNPADWLSGGSVYTPNANTVQPYGQEYRYQPHRVHPVFKEIPGYPFITWDSANYYDWLYHQDEEYNSTFQTSQVGQWQAHLRCQATKLTQIPDVHSSIYAGAR